MDGVSNSPKAGQLSYDRMGRGLDEDYIARDIMQNFFDANRDRLTAVLVTVDGTKVTVSSPVPFNLERLFFLGSEKGADDIGQ